MRLMLTATMLSAGLLCGCDVGLGASVLIVNESSETLTLKRDGSRLKPNGGTWGIELQGCSDADLVFLSKSGEVFVEITDPWCARETWTITRDGEVVRTKSD